MNGIYKLTKLYSVESSSSKSGYTSFSGPICFLLPTSIIFIILIPLLNKFSRSDAASKSYEERVETSPNDKNQSTQKGKTEKKEDDAELKLKTKDYFKLLLKSKPIGIFGYIFYSNLCLSLVFQIIIYKITEFNVFLIGPLSCLIVSPISYILFNLRSQKNQYLSFFAPILLIIASTFTVFILGGFEKWFISCIIGILSELVCIQLVAILYINSCRAKI